MHDVKYKLVENLRCVHYHYRDVLGVLDVSDSVSEIIYFVEWEYVHFTLLKQVNQIYMSILCTMKLMHTPVI
jgi:hypothetical protein